ncbi:MAG TPA: NAD(P)H-dependent oxidoreductase subunit E [Candidatus Dormibacteraeota bacterium]|nr:NAD(P)H-dependent oxidoreductase subunit E [Candidatus Dormibacteraeota bacterium]
MTQREKDFPDLSARLRPQCVALVAQYEEPRSALLPIIHLFQEHEGFVSKEAMRFAAELLALSPGVVESTVSFYSLFFRKPVGKYVLQVCRGLSCSINGAQDIMAYLREQLGIGHLQTSDDGLFSYEEVECLAACDRATCMQVNLEFFYDLTPQRIDEMIAAMRSGTFAVKPMVQSDRPERSWTLKQDGEVARGGKAPGAQGVSAPNNAGGVGDSSGVIMLDRFVLRDDTPSMRARSQERFVQDAALVAEVIEG